MPFSDPVHRVMIVKSTRPTYWVIGNPEPIIMPFHCFWDAGRRYNSVHCTGKGCVGCRDQLGTRRLRGWAATYCIASQQQYIIDLTAGALESLAAQAAGPLRIGDVLAIHRRSSAPQSALLVEIKTPKKLNFDPVYFSIEETIKRVFPGGHILEWVPWVDLLREGGYLDREPNIEP